MAGKFRVNTCVYGSQKKMAGKSETVNLVDHQKQNKWRENSTARATTEEKEMAGKSATTHGSAEAKNGGKILWHVLKLRNGGNNRLNMELDLQSLFELLCTAVLIG